MMATAPEESVNPTRDVPLAIGISVTGCTILYLLMALVISGMHQGLGYLLIQVMASSSRLCCSECGICS